MIDIYAETKIDGSMSGYLFLSVSSIFFVKKVSKKQHFPSMTLK
jgi:hypothetical protein